MQNVTRHPFYNSCLYKRISIIVLTAVLFAACKTPRDSKIAIADKLYQYRWKLVELNGQLPTPANTTPYLEFTKENEARVAGFAGCNRLSGSFALTGNNLKFGPIITTRMACANNHDETPFLSALEKSTSFSIAGSSLSVINNGITLARFEGESRQND